MKKTVRKFLFVIPIFGLLMSMQPVSADNACESGAPSRTVKLQNTGATVDVPGIHNRANFYQFSLGGADGSDGTPALCLNAGKKLSNGNSFNMKSSSQVTDPNLIKAYTYAKNNSGDTGKVMAAQIYTWTAQSGSTDFDGAVSQGLQNAGYSASQAYAYVNEIRAQSSSTKLYVFKGPNGEVQDMLAEAGPDDIPCEPSCSLSISGGLPPCEGTGKANYGSFSEEPVGKCADEYNTDDVDSHGKGVFLNKLCKIGCKSKVYITLPGNVNGTVGLGRYIVWPNSSNSNSLKAKKNLTIYPLSFAFSEECGTYINKNRVKEYDTAKRDMASLSKYASGYLTDKCSSLNEKVKYAEKELEKAENRLASCEQSATSENKDGTDPCVYERMERKTASNNLNSATEEVNHCNEYGKAYTLAQTIIGEYNACSNVSGGGADNSVGSVILSYDDPEYGGTFNLTTGSSNGGENAPASRLNMDPNKVDGSMLSEKTSELENRVISSNKGSSSGSGYELPNGLYHYVDKITQKSVHSTAGLKNFSTIGFSNLPVSFHADPTKEYSLKLSISGTLDGMSFGGDYVCKYKVSPSSKCECPEGTKESGTDLTCLINTYNSTHTEKITCADGQVLYCDSEITVPDTQCTTTCPNDPSIDLSVCINSGESYTECVTKFCDTTVKNIVCPPSTENSGMDLSFCTDTLSNCVADWCNGDINDNPPDDLVCPSGTENTGMDLSACVENTDDYAYCVDLYCTDTSNEKPTPGDKTKKPVCPSGTNEGMDLSACVYPMVNSGLSYEEALIYCVDVTCPGGIRIIWRKISLENPFPSYDADKTVTQTGLEGKPFNDQIRGRFPGSNWNSKSVVNNKILTNRGSDGRDIYQEAEPLYTFVLNSKNIKEIREYNKKQSQGYNDFKLDCKNNNSRACVSNDFVHNKIYGLTSGTCSGNIATAASFESCVTRRGA